MVSRWERVELGSRSAEKLKSMIEERYNRFQHRLTMGRIELHIAKTEAAEVYEVFGQRLHYYETRVRAGDKESVDRRNRVKSAMEWAVSSGRDTVDYWERMVERNVLELKQIKQQREMIEKGFAPASR
ncbi:hypothetical protein G7Y79_00026g059480 [Physcia stellaris]|nr:hypothetical protein G7Y79_00026g059480 [Physcia stellaris]